MDVRPSNREIATSFRRASKDCHIAFESIRESSGEAAELVMRYIAPNTKGGTEEFVEYSGCLLRIRRDLLQISMIFDDIAAKLDPPPTE